MIITQTPYRVSFAGGGTDLPAFYQQEYGAVFSVAIQKHMYVTLSYRFEPSTRAVLRVYAGQLNFNQLLAAPGDDRTLAEQAIALMTSPDLRAKLSQGALSLAEEFSWSRIADRHLALYEDAH